MHSPVSCVFGHMHARTGLFQSFAPLRSPLPTFPKSQVNIKYSLLPWWQPKVLMCWNSCLQPSLFLPCLYCACLYAVSIWRWKAYQKCVQWSSMDTVFCMQQHISHTSTCWRCLRRIFPISDKLERDPLLCHYSTLLEDHHSDTFK